MNGKKLTAAILLAAMLIVPSAYAAIVLQDVSTSTETQYSVQGCSLSETISAEAIQYSSQTGQDDLHIIVERLDPTDTDAEWIKGVLGERADGTLRLVVIDPGAVDPLVIIETTPSGSAAVLYQDPSLIASGYNPILLAAVAEKVDQEVGNSHSTALKAELFALTGC